MERYEGTSSSHDKNQMLSTVKLEILAYVRWDFVASCICSNWFICRVDHYTEQFIFMRPGVNIMPLEVSEFQCFLIHYLLSHVLFLSHCMVASVNKCFTFLVLKCDARYDSQNFVIFRPIGKLVKQHRSTK